MSQVYIYPNPAAAANPSIGTNGQNPAPTSSTEVAGINPSGALQPLQTNAAGSLLVAPDPATITSENLVQVAGNAVGAGAGASTTGTLRVIQSTDSTIGLNAGTNNVGSITNVTGTVSLPTGASTASLQTTTNSTLGSILLDLTNGTQITQITGTVPLPTGAATSANQATEISSLASIVANQTNGTQKTQVTSFPSDSTPATQNITVVDSGTTATPFLNGQTWYTGTPTANSAATFVLPSSATGQVEISGTWTGTLQCEISVDGGVTYVSHSIHQIGSPLFISTFTNNVIGSLNLAGKTHMRLRATAAITGTATVRVTESINDTSIYVANAIKLVDGSSTTSTTTATIKAASTAAATTDTSFVVALSPNSPISGAGVAGTPAGGVVSVQGVSGGTAIPVSPTGTQNINLTQVGGTAVALGQAASTASIPVALSNEDVQDQSITGAAAQTAVVNNILTVTSGTAATDLIAYRSFSVQVVSTGTAGTFIFEGSNDNTNFQAIPVFNQNLLTGVAINTAITATASQFIYQGAAQFRYLRLRIATTITGGSIQAFSKYSIHDFSPSVREVANSVAGNLVTTIGAALPAGAAIIGTVKLVDTAGTNLGSIKAASTVAVAADTSLVVQMSPNGTTPKASGRTTANAPVQNLYTTTAVTTTTYLQLIASTTSATNYIDIFDSSGQTMILAIGASGSEVIQFYVPPGGAVIPLAIPAATRVAIKALTATANVGYINVNLLT